MKAAAQNLIFALSALPSRMHAFWRTHRDSSTTVLSLFVFAGIYYFYFVRAFLNGDIVMAGATHLLWSLDYLALHTLAEYGEFLWWDPTALNGWPAYLRLTSGWFNYLSPYNLPSLILFLFGSGLDVSINGFLVFQKTVYYFSLNLLAVILLSNELVASRVARWLPPLLFTLGAVPMAGFRDSVLWQAMAAPLFVLFALVHYNRRRTEESLLLLIGLSILLLASLNHGALRGALWWLGLFAIFLFSFHLELLGITAGLLRSAWNNSARRQLLLLFLLLGVLAAATLLLARHYGLGNIIRPNELGPITYDTAGRDSFGTLAKTLSHPLWTNFLLWAPTEVIHELFLRIEEKVATSAVIEYRYIGLVTLPLLFVAAVRGHCNRTLWALLLTAITCLLFVALGDRNLFMRVLADTVFNGEQTVAYTLPRDGPAIMLILCAGVGLDHLLKGDTSNQNTGQREEPTALDPLLHGSLILMAVVALVSLFLAFVPLSLLADIQAFQTQRLLARSIPDITEAFAHVGVYLFLYTFLCLVIMRVPARARSFFAVGMLTMVFFDMTASASAYWDRGRAWVKKSGQHTLPSAAAIGPILSPLQAWPGAYGGLIHNPYSSQLIGTKSWLILATRGPWRGLLENWDSDLRMMRSYPDFRFFSSAVYLPFDAIRRIDAIQPPGNHTFYLHDEGNLRPYHANGKRLTPLWEITEFRPNYVRIKVDMPEPGFMLSLDNYDRFWSAFIDGHRTIVHRANFAFKAIRLDAGTHVIEWRYSPTPIKIGWAAFYLILLIVLGRFVIRVRWGWTIVLSLFAVGITMTVTWNPERASKIEASSASPDPLIGFSPGTWLPLQDGQFKGWLPIGTAGAFHVVPGLGGSLESLSIDRYGMTTAQGWAIDQPSGQPARAVLIAVNNRLWLLTRPQSGRNDVAEGLGKGFWGSGFVAYGRGATKEDLRTIRAYALLRDGTARELLYSPGVKRNAP